jgi:aconitase B
MAKGPRGEKRPADVNARAVMIAKIATGEIEDTKTNPASALARLGGLKGGHSRAKKLSASERAEIARKAASARWAARSR